MRQTVRPSSRPGPADDREARDMGAKGDEHGRLAAISGIKSGGVRGSVSGRPGRWVIIRTGTARGVARVWCHPRLKYVMPLVRCVTDA